MMADRKKISNLLKTARGQIVGLLKMVEDDRYCVDISHQLLATAAILKKANREVLKAHLDHCIADAMSGDSQIDKEAKLKELSELLLTWEKV